MPVRRHLRRVYANLTVTALFAALATFLYTLGWLPRADMLVMISGFTALTAIRFIPNRAGLRHGLLYGFGFTQGWSLGPLVQYYADINPVSILQAILAGAALFAAFTGSALMVERRAYLYIASVIMALSLVGLVIALMGWLGFSFESSFLSQILIGLAISCFFVIYDTQVIIEQVEAGINTEDPVQHSANLFIDLLSIVSRMLVVLNQDNQGRQQRKGRKPEPKKENESRGPL